MSLDWSSGIKELLITGAVAGVKAGSAIEDAVREFGDPEETSVLRARERLLTYGDRRLQISTRDDRVQLIGIYFMETTAQTQFVGPCPFTEKSTRRDVTEKLQVWGIECRSSAKYPGALETSGAIVVFDSNGTIDSIQSLLK